MDVLLTNLGVSKDVLVNKLEGDFKHGVKVRSGNIECVDVIRAWTDSQDWQFSLIGLYECDKHKLDSVVIQSIGISKLYLQMRIKIVDFMIKMERISRNFGELEGVNDVEANRFIDGYMKSTFNRYLTQQLFDELAADENYQQWLIF